jgi:hypothetical protein
VINKDFLNWPPFICVQTHITGTKQNPDWETDELMIYSERKRALLGAKQFKGMKEIRVVQCLISFPREKKPKRSSKRGK